MTWRELESIPTKVHVAIRRYAPEYRLRLLNDTDCAAFVGRHCGAAALRRYHALSTPAHRADIWRYCAVWAFGGVYLDVKTWLIRPLRQIFSAANAAYTVIPAPPLHRAIYNGILAAPPRDPTVRALLDDIVQGNLTRLNNDYFHVMKQAYKLLSVTLRAPPAAGTHLVTVASGRRWVLFREVEDATCSVPDKWGKCFRIVDDRWRRTVFRTRYPDFPAGFMPRPRANAAAARRFSCRAGVTDAAPCLNITDATRTLNVSSTCPADGTTLSDCQRLCAAAGPACVALVHNVYGNCFLRRERRPGTERSDSPAHGTMLCEAARVAATSTHAAVARARAGGRRRRWRCEGLSCSSAKLEHVDRGNTGWGPSRRLPRVP
jgi:hypothetical protein